MSEVNQEPAAEYVSSPCEEKILDQARTILSKRLKTTSELMTSPVLTKDFCALQLHAKEREVFGVLFLNNQNRLIEYVELFQGTIDAATVYPREVVKEALRLNAVALILTHNHPSGVSKASDADKRITRRIQDACELMGMRVLDHIIVGETCLSFAEEGLL